MMIKTYNLQCNIIFKLTWVLSMYTYFTKKQAYLDVHEAVPRTFEKY